MPLLSATAIHKPPAARIGPELDRHDLVVWGCDPDK